MYCSHVQFVIVGQVLSLAPGICSFKFDLYFQSWFLSKSSY